MIVISPFLSFAIGLTYGSIVPNGWAIPAAISILFPIGFLTRLNMLIRRTFMKEEVDRSI
ncbi:MAG: hypothetical protein ACQEUT_18785 [Bacillota bacterium]